MTKFLKQVQSTQAIEARDIPFEGQLLPQEVACALRASRSLPISWRAFSRIYENNRKQN